MDALIGATKFIKIGSSSLVFCTKKESQYVHTFRLDPIFAEKKLPRRIPDLRLKNASGLGGVSSD